MRNPIRYEHLYRTVNGVKETYMKRLTIGRLNLHLFYRGDGDEDPHDHPWSFWTFPLHDYVEEVYDPITKARHFEVVGRFRWHFRHASHAHRVIGRRPLLVESVGWVPSPRKFATIVWKTPKLRDWGFWTPAGWVYWRDYFVKTCNQLQQDRYLNFREGAPTAIPKNAVEIDYTNWRGERAKRLIIPLGSPPMFTSNEWHPKEQWLLSVHDIEKGADRIIAMKDIHSWTPVKLP